MSDIKSWIFDVDGVITDPITRTITKPEIVTHIVTSLSLGNPVGLISGRGLLWLRSRVIKIFENYLDDHPVLDRNLLDNLFISAEFGGAKLHYKNGERIEEINKAFVIPNDIRSVLTQCAAQFSAYVFVDQEKQTQFTLEANYDKNINLLDEHRDEIIQTLSNLLVNNPQLEVHSDRIAINVKNKNAHKLYAMEQYLSWLQDKSLPIATHYVFGDSPSDIEMGKALAQKQIHFNFIYVGEEADLKNEVITFPIIYTKSHCDAGTSEYLATFS